MNPLQALLHGFLGLSPLEENPYVIRITDDTFYEQVSAYEGPVVVLYTPSCERTEIPPLAKKQLKYTERAFARSARHFKKDVKFAYFDLESCFTPEETTALARYHLNSYHHLKGFPTVVFYEARISSIPLEEELTRVETGIPSPKDIRGYTEMLDFLTYHNLVLQDTFYQLINGRIEPLDVANRKAL